MKRLAFATVLTLACPATAPAKAPLVLPRPEVPIPRITAVDARYAANAMFRNYAEGLSERLVISPCKARGKRSRTCVVRVGRDRYLAVSSYANASREVIAASRRLPRR